MTVKHNSKLTRAKVRSTKPAATPQQHAHWTISMVQTADSALRVGGLAWKQLSLLNTVETERPAARGEAQARHIKLAASAVELAIHELRRVQAALSAGPGAVFPS